MSITTDPNDPALGHGVDETPRPQQEKYLVLPEAERARGFVRPLRHSYKHVGPPGPTHPLRDLTDEERLLWKEYAKYEVYPEGSLATGKFWTQKQFDSIGKGCGMVTTMAHAIAETYAVNPHFYGSTYCMGCQMHLPVNEFVWTVDGARVGS